MCFYKDQKRRRWLTVVYVLPVLCVVVFSLSACRADVPVEVAQSTLVATLDLSVRGEEDTATPSATFPFEPFEPSISETPLPPGRATRTFTPWPTSTPTIGPSPTRTRTSTLTRIPTQTRAPTLTRTITRTPTVTFTPTPPAPIMQVHRPGILSKVVSPIQTDLTVLTGAGGKVTIELLGEDGRVISYQELNYFRMGRSLRINPEVPFEISSVSEMARLQVTTADEFGRMVARASVDLILLSVGRNVINPPSIVHESYVIRSPRREATVQGGTLIIEGLARPVNASPLLVELVTESGQIMAARQLEITQPDGDLSHTPFSLEIPYTVNGPTPIRMVFRQEGSRIPGTVAQFSRLIVLEP
jgi:hypothetical protein